MECRIQRKSPYFQRPKQNPANCEIQPADLQNYGRILQLERSLPAKVLQAPDPEKVKLQSITASVNQSGILPAINGADDGISTM